MSVFFSLIGFACFVFMLIGFFSPKTSLFWIKDANKRKRGLSFVVYFFSFMFFSLLVSITDDGDNDAEVTTKSEPRKENVSVTEEKEIPETPSNWDYSTSFDEMTEKTMYFATATLQLRMNTPCL